MPLAPFLLMIKGFPENAESCCSQLKLVLDIVRKIEDLLRWSCAL